jgi:hypothetical protein
MAPTDDLPPINVSPPERGFQTMGLIPENCANENGSLLISLYL